MKKYGCFKIGVFAIVLVGWTVCSHALELIPLKSGFTWETDVSGPCSFDIGSDGTAVNLSAQGTESEVSEIDVAITGTSKIVGMWATVHVDQAVNNAVGTNILADSVYIGIKQYVGRVGNEKIRLSITLNQYNDQRSIWYQVRGYHVTTNAVREIAQGTIGAVSGRWNPGDSLTMAFVRVGSEFWFYVNGVPELLKIQAIGEVTGYYGQPNIFARAGKGTNSLVAGSVSNIYLIKE